MTKNESAQDIYDYSRSLYSIAIISNLNQFDQTSPHELLPKGTFVVLEHRIVAGTRKSLPSRTWWVILEERSIPVQCWDKTCLRTFFSLRSFASFVTKGALGLRQTELAGLDEVCWKSLSSCSAKSGSHTSCK